MQNQFDSFILHFSPTLSKKIKNFWDSAKDVTRKDENDFSFMSNSIKNLKTTTKDNLVYFEADLIEVPKIFADIIEAILGAILMDSDSNFQKCCEIISNLIDFDEIDNNWEFKDSKDHFAALKNDVQSKGVFR